MTPPAAPSPGRSLYLLSFNRPQILRKTLESLKAQSGRQNWSVSLFQDGPRPDAEASDSAAIEECVSLFGQFFPGERIFRSPNNIGIGLNMLAAQRQAFESQKLEVAYFFEDDLVLHPEYLHQLGTLENLFRPHEDRVPYFSAYGTIHTRSIPAAVRPGSEFSYMEHLWGFGLFRRHWELEQRILAPYFEHLSQTPYRDRDHEWIRQLFERAGFPLDITSQDGARMVALVASGRCALRTNQPLASYHGEVGTHCDPRTYEEWGFGKVAPEPTARAVAPVITEDFLSRACARYPLAPLYFYPPGGRVRLAEAREREAGARTAQAEARARDAEARAAEAHTRALEAQADAREHEIRAQELLASTCWRITAPLRAAARVLGRIRSFVFSPRSR